MRKYIRNKSSTLLLLFKVTKTICERAGPNAHDWWWWCDSHVLPISGGNTVASRQSSEISVINPNSTHMPLDSSLFRTSPQCIHFPIQEEKGCASEQGTGGSILQPLSRRGKVSLCKILHPKLLPTAEPSECECMCQWLPLVMSRWQLRWLSLQPAYEYVCVREWIYAPSPLTRLENHYLSPFTKTKEKTLHQNNKNNLLFTFDT